MPLNYGAQSRINMFDMPKVINLTLPVSYGSNPVLMNYPIDRTNFTLVRGVPNTIQVFVRDVDRHIDAISLANAVLTLNVVDTKAETVLLRRDLYTVDATTALYGVTTQPSDTLDWPTGDLRYSIQVLRADGSSSLLWTDRNYSPYGVCTVIDGPLPGPAVPVTLNPTTFLISTGYSYSTALPGSASTGYPNGLQTFTFATTAYTGHVVVQASLLSQPSTTASDWFDVSAQDFSNVTGVTAVNVTGNFLWVRVVYPVTGSTLISNLTPQIVSGTINSILYLV